jgi:hypothetical protein
LRARLARPERPPADRRRVAEAVPEPASARGRSPRDIRILKV